ncbi:RNA-dependent RNA polymerase 1 [Lecanosticta acicola]|uniref:RNA-dependent RNA polymerase n=1 Tax=Lecanosticta acicola TaxID=111012 RepID=A0AAI9EC76_9PEZI|nr:RNA-dependent RNA polymerase 1 [Lecanosticta acicola]
MDIFVRNIPPHMTIKELNYFFTGPLKDCGIDIFYAEKHRDKPTATITVLDVNCGQVFLNQYGLPPNAPRHIKPLRRLHYADKLIICQKSNHEPSDFSLKSLHYEATQRAKAVVANTAPQHQNRNKQLNRFDVRELQCGMWDYEGSRLAFTSHFTDNRSGKVIFGRKEAIVLIGPPGANQSRIDINYQDCFDINLGTYEEPSVTFNLGTAPRMYEISAQETLAAAMAALTMGSRKAQAPKKLRLSAINDFHARVAGTCFVYRVTLQDNRVLANIKALLRNAKTSVLSYKTHFRYPLEPLENSFTRLATELTTQSAGRFGRKPFKLRYQVERLAKNGLLSPQKVMLLLPAISKLYDAYKLDATVAALRRFARDVKAEPPGPSTQAHEYSLESLKALLEEYAISYDTSAPENPYELAKRHKHINLVHKVVVTPCGTYLEGPEPEPTNRVLRRYARPDYFIRVVFQDEDGGPVRHDGRTNQELVYHKRFQSILDGSMLFCGLGFSFLGFSNSSLRAQSCWFMATMFSREGKMIFTDHVIKELGDFSHIRVPAKCAARIGQNFTDTNSTVRVQEHEVYDLPMVVRNGRDFSDGVGTISLELLQAVWEVYGTRKLLKPTALQIRFQGAKGMVSLDTRLPGRRLMLRDNMRKYNTAVNWDLEICGAAFRPLPMVLNRPFIKIFEDLGIGMQVFLDLQRDAMDHLRKMTQSSINTALFLEEAEGIKATRLPSLIRHLGQIGHDYHQDEFLYQVVEMAVVSKLRDFKYRGRYPVPDGVTLYGIMDETGYLKEGQIYVVTEKEGGKEVLVQNQVVVTRSPALHPGDIQVVQAIDVPPNSPLKKLSNVVAFSKYGDRDLPSQLGGGDLDGDLYNIIWDQRLIPRSTYMAADYPRVEAVQLDREVTRKDMSDFFVTFMESDLLGKICTEHLQLADQRAAGTLDPDCISLAQKASTAVDFSKTGIPVDMRSAPKMARCKPDFMAPDPRVVISESGYLDFEEDEVEDDDAFEGLDIERRPMRYYFSQKTLGHLYRNIDERMFLAKMQQQHRTLAPSLKPQDLLPRVLKYVKHWASQYGLIYSHHKALAKDIQAQYEDSLINILYDYEPTPRSPLSEIEVFAGQILGRKGGPQNKPLRELAQTMRERFEVVVDYTVMRITKGDKAMREANDLDDLYEETARYTEREFEALPRAVACLDVAVNGRGLTDRKLGELKSFRYVAAGVCLRELERYRITTFGSLSGLPSAWDVSR